MIRLRLGARVHGIRCSIKQAPCADDFRDITEKKRSAEELARQRECYQREKTGGARFAAGGFA